MPPSDTGLATSRCTDILAFHGGRPCKQTAPKRVHEQGCANVISRSADGANIAVALRNSLSVQKPSMTSMQRSVSWKIFVQADGVIHDEGFEALAFGKSIFAMVCGESISLVRERRTLGHPAHFGDCETVAMKLRRSLYGVVW